MVLIWFLVTWFACPMPERPGGKLPLNPPGGRIVMQNLIQF